MQSILLSAADAAYRRVYFTAVDVADLQSRLTGLTGFTVKISKNGVATITGGGSVAEVDDTDLPGVYYYECATGDIDTLGNITLRITNTGMEPREITCYVSVRSEIAGVPDVNVTNWRNDAPNVLVGGNVQSDVRAWIGTAPATPTTAGVPRVDVKAMESGVVTATAIADNAIDSATFAADVNTRFGIARRGTATAGGASTITLDGSAVATNSYYKNTKILIESGTGVGQVRGYASYVGSTKVYTVDSAWTVQPDNTSVFALIPDVPVDGAGFASAFWDTTAETTLSYGDLLRLIAALNGGVSGDFRTGTLVFKALSDASTTRVTITVDESGRLSTTIGDPT